MGLGCAIVRNRLRRKARMFLADRFGCRICVPCGYDLTGNTSGICPECGAAVPKWTAFDAKRSPGIDRSAQE